MAYVWRIEYRAIGSDGEVIEYFDAGSSDRSSPRLLAIACVKEHNGIRVDRVVKYHDDVTEVWPSVIASEDER